MLSALKAQLRIFVQAHAPQFGHIFGWRRDESETVTTGSRGDLQQQQQKARSALQSSLKTYKMVC